MSIFRVFITDLQYNRPPTPHNLYRFSRQRCKSCNETPLCRSVTPHWMSLMSLKNSPFSACFTFGKRKKKRLLVPNLASRGVLDHTNGFAGKKLLHIQRAESVLFVMPRQPSAVSNCSLLTWPMREYKRSITTK